MKSYFNISKRINVIVSGTRVGKGGRPHTF